MIDIMPFGPCTLQDPLHAYAKKSRKQIVFGAMGFRGRPFCLSINQTHQLVDYLAGDLDFTPWVKELAYSRMAEKPTKDKGRMIYDCEVAIVEVSTNVEYTFDGDLVNINRVDDLITTQAGVGKKLLAMWRAALLKGDDENRKVFAEEIHRLFPKDTAERQNVAELVLDLRSRTLDIDEQTKSLADLRDRMKMPMCMLLHNWGYMPDGRPVLLPAGFKDQCVEMARRLDMPTYDYAPFVVEVGVRNALLDDMRHWADRWQAPAGEKVHGFCASVLDGQPARARPAALKSPPEPEADIDDVIPFPSTGRAATLPGAANLDAELHLELADMLEKEAALNRAAARAQRGYAEAGA